MSKLVLAPIGVGLLGFFELSDQWLNLKAYGCGRLCNGKAAMLAPRMQRQRSLAVLGGAASEYSKSYFPAGNCFVAVQCDV